MASNSGWTTGLPSGQSTVDQTDDEFRSLKSYVEAWLEQEHYVTDGSTTSAGIAKHGAGRAFVGTASQLSNPTSDNDGRLFYVSDEGVLRIGNASTSSWSIVADTVTLASDNSWTGTNSFNTLARQGVFSNITSTSSTLAAAQGTAAESWLKIHIAPTHPFTAGDFLLASVDTYVGGAPPGDTYVLQAHLDSLGSLVVGFANINTVSRVTFPTGAVMSVMGFVQ